MNKREKIRSYLDEWDNIKHDSINGSIAINKSAGIFVYYLYHSSMDTLEVYTITRKELSCLIPGESPIEYLDYYCLALFAF